MAIFLDKTALVNFPMATTVAAMISNSQQGPRIIIVLRNKKKLLGGYPFDNFMVWGIFIEESKPLQIPKGLED